MAKRYELSDAQWGRIAELLPGKPGDRGRTAKDNRAFVDGVLWVPRSGARWSDLPERYGKWKSVHKRFTRWAKAGIWERVFAALTRDRRNEYLMLDTSLVRAHQQAATGKGGQRSGSGALPRRTDSQNSSAGRCARQASAVHPHARSSPRSHPSLCPARRTNRSPRHCRQGLRQQWISQPRRQSGRKGRCPRQAHPDCHHPP